MGVRRIFGGSPAPSRHLLNHIQSDNSNSVEEMSLRTRTQRGPNKMYLVLPDGSFVVALEVQDFDCFNLTRWVPEQII